MFEFLSPHQDHQDQADQSPYLKLSLQELRMNLHMLETAENKEGIDPTAIEKLRAAIAIKQKQQPPPTNH